VTEALDNLPELARVALAVAFVLSLYLLCRFSMRHFPAWGPQFDPPKKHRPKKPRIKL